MSECRPARRHISLRASAAGRPTPTRCAVTSHLLPVFARIDLAFDRGEGCWLVATNGERYLDFGTGIAVNSLGHAHPHLVEKLTEQVGKLWHISTLYKMCQSLPTCSVSFSTRCG